MKLREIAHARTGNKGDASTISVIAYRSEDFDRIAREVTVERVASHFSGFAPASVERYELPRIGALNFVLRGALKGGVTRSLALDAHGKCIGASLLDLDLPDAP